jgi:hypothetical protein
MPIATQEAETRRITVQNKPWANSSRDPISKSPITKNWAAGVAQGEGLEFKPQYHKTNKQKLIWGHRTPYSIIPSKLIQFGIVRKRKSMVLSGC